MRVLAFDTETTGLPTNYDAPPTDSAKWPHIIQLSFILFDTDKKEILEYSDHIIALDPTVHITSESVAVHQITRERSIIDGIPICQALYEFAECIKNADLIVGHNVIFDIRMVQAELHRNQLPNCFVNAEDNIPVPDYCTMKKNVARCQLPNPNKKYANNYKWPTLSELHQHLFGAKPKGTHNAIADVMICLRCYVIIMHEYDIAYDNEVKMVFRSLYNNYCGGDTPRGGLPPY